MLQIHYNSVILVILPYYYNYKYNIFDTNITKE